jgi:hypothetical protein
MKQFRDLEFKKLGDPHNGVQATINFDNGLGASVVSHQFSYGGKSGLYELAVLDKNGDLTYDTPVTNDVIGWLDESKVTETMAFIQSL